MSVVGTYVALAIGAIMLYLVLSNGSQSSQIIGALSTSNVDAIKSLQGR